MVYISEICTGRIIENPDEHPYQYNIEVTHPRGFMSLLLIVHFYLVPNLD